MYPRKIYDFQSTGRNKIREWLDDQEDAVSAKFEALVPYIEKGESLQEPISKPIKGKKYKGLFEFILEVEKRQIRIFFCYGKFERGAIVLLAGAVHKQRVYDPPSVFDTALKRKDLCENDRGFICEHES